MDLEAVADSDQNAITFDINATSAPSSARSSTYLFNNKTAKWHKFSTFLANEMVLRGPSEEDVFSANEDVLENICLRLTDIIRTACRASMKMRGKRRDSLTIPSGITIWRR